MNFVNTLGISTATLANILYQNQELSFYSVCLECMPNLQAPSTNAVIASILWTKVNNPREHDVFWAKLTDVLLHKKMFQKAYQAVQNIVDAETQRSAIGMLVESAIVNKKLSLIRDELPLPGLKREVC